MTDKSIIITIKQSKFPNNKFRKQKINSKNNLSQKVIYKNQGNTM